MRAISEPGRAIACAALAVCVLLADRHSFAAPPLAPASPPAASTDEADALFEQGRRLMEQGALDEACIKLEKSFQLAPRLGAMLNLGSCFERRGQLARAIAVYEQAATLARQLGRPDREAAAREFAAALAPKVTKLLLVIEEPSAGLVTTVDGETVSTRAGITPLDPGHRRLSARAPGKVPFETALDLVAGGTTTVTIPVLRDEPRATSPAAPPPSSGSSTARTLGIVGGFALAGAGVTLGTVYGLRAKSKHDLSNGECDPTGCSPQGIAYIDDAKSSAVVSTAAFIAGGIAFAATIAVVLLTGDSTSRRTGAAPLRNVAQILAGALAGGPGAVGTF